MIRMFWLVLLIAAAIQSVTPQPVPAGALSVRIHHLHYRSADPLSAMRLAAGKDASPEILQGLGAGVRDGAEYLLFDRGNVEENLRSPAIADAYPQMAAWFRAQGVEVQGDPGRVVALGERVSNSFLQHIGFATSNLPGLLERMQRSGVRVIRQNDESFLIPLAGAFVPVEVLRDPDLPDRFWCAMHPDVRSPAAGACPICRMTLVPIPAPKLGEYRVEFTSAAGRGGRGLGSLRVRVSEPDSDRAVSSFVTVHDKPMHLFLVSRDLSYFAHVHPTPSGSGSFDIRVDAPAGEYMALADFLPAGGTPQMIQRALVTPGFELVSGGAPVAAPSPNRVATTGDIHGSLTSSELVAGRAATLTVALTDARSGALLRDLEPFLAAPAHGFIASFDLTSAVHAHPRDRDTFGSEFSFDFLPPQSGLFKIWVQVQRRGKVETLPFVVRVGER